jgi:hypothetical protein
LARHRQVEPLLSSDQVIVAVLADVEALRPACVDHDQLRFSGVLHQRVGWLGQFQEAFRLAVGIGLVVAIDDFGEQRDADAPSVWRAFIYRGFTVDECAAHGAAAAAECVRAADRSRAHASGESATTIATTLGVSRATVYRVLGSSDN